MTGWARAGEDTYGKPVTIGTMASALAMAMTRVLLTSKPIPTAFTGSVTVLETPACRFINLCPLRLLRAALLTDPPARLSDRL